MNSRTCSLAAALLASASPALAAEEIVATADAVAASESDEPIIVEGRRAEYGARATTTATKTHTDIKNVPQALSVISEKQIEDQQLRSIADLLWFVPGATPGTGEANRDQFTLRGNNTTADFFVDGIRDDVQYFRDLYNVDRVEVLRGPNAMIFGRGGGGGIVNRVIKRSSLGDVRQFAISGDSQGGVRMTGDFDQPVGPGTGVRVNGMFEEGESFRRHVDLERYAVNPTFGLLAGPRTRIDAGYQYLKDSRTTDRGVPSRDGRPIEGLDNIFFGDPDKSFAKADVHIATVALQHQLGSDLTLRNRTTYGNYDKFYQNIYPNGAVATEGPNAGMVRLSAYNDTTIRKNLFSQTDLIWERRLGGVEHVLLAGFEVGRQTGRNQRRNGIFSDTGTSSISAPVADPTVDVPVTFLPTGANNGMKASIAALYLQDQVRLSDMVEIVAGVRFDRFSLEIDDLKNDAGFERTDELVSPRIGLVVKPAPNLSLYGSFSRSYLPSAGDQFNSLDLTSEALKPERFDNYEIGAKWEPIAGLLATAAIYQLDRTNTRATDPLDPARIVLTGAQRSRGLELGLERSISDRWQISAGYALQDAEISRTTTAAPKGRDVPLVPRHSFSLWNRYDISKQLGVGLGVIARSKSYASLSNAVTLPSYARVDAAAFYKLTRNVDLQVNVENLFGSDYFPTAHNDNNIAPGAPTTVKATLRFGL